MKGVANEDRERRKYVKRDANDEVKGAAKGDDDVNEDKIAAVEEATCKIGDTAGDEEGLDTHGAYGIASAYLKSYHKPVCFACRPF